MIETHAHAGERALDTIDDADVKAIWNDVSRVDDLRASVLEDIRWIEVQLGDRNRQVVDEATGEHRRNTDEEYWNWRHRAVGARTHKLTLYRRLKDRVRELNINKPADPESASAYRRTVGQALESVEQKLDEILALLRKEGDAWKYSIQKIAVEHANGKHNPADENDRDYCPACEDEWVERQRSEA